MEIPHCILIVDDNPHLREGIKSILKGHQEFEVGGEAGDSLETKILVLTIHKSPEYQTAVLNAGADGFLHKDSSQVELIQSIHDVLKGRPGFPANLGE
jgi:DNA-binding NarL/FixJ family response regulator